MNSRLKTNSRVTALIALALALLLPCSANAGDDADDYGLWTSFEVSKKINKQFKATGEFEFRTSDYLKEVERFSAGIGLQYKPAKWFKANAGYIFIAGYNPTSTSAKDNSEWIDLETGESEWFPNYNVDHSYWEKRNRVYISATGDCKIGRVSLSLRERLQYTRTNSALIDEDKHRHDAVLGGPRPTETIERNKELKEHKNNTVLRSRITAKWDIAKCKINPFASAELYSRIDKWRGFEKLRSRVGASYKIDKDNSIELYYLFEKAGEKGKGNTHAIGIGYSIDL